MQNKVSNDEWMYLCAVETGNRMSTGDFQNSSPASCVHERSISVHETSPAMICVYLGRNESH